MARRGISAAGSEREFQFLRVWRMVVRSRDGLGVGEPVAQYRFSESRQWRFDFAWPQQRVAVEIDGGTRGRPVHCHRCGVRVRAKRADGQPGREIRLGGGHNRGPAFFAGIEKQNAAVLAGWRVLRVVEEDLDAKPVQVVEMVLAALAGAGSRGDGVSLN